MEAVSGEIALETSEDKLGAAEAYAANAAGAALMLTCSSPRPGIWGVPCRFVSGYLVRGRTGEATCHAWVEAHVADLGWVGFDPLNNLCPQGEHVRGAVGFDALGAAFVRGTHAEGTGHVLKVSVTG